MIADAALRVIARDGALTLQLRCPQCKRWGDIDDDQLHGRVSVDHTDVYRGVTRCTYHETHDWSQEAVWLSNDTSRRLGWGPWTDLVRAVYGEDA